MFSQSFRDDDVFMSFYTLTYKNNSSAPKIKKLENSINMANRALEILDDLNQEDWTDDQHIEFETEYNNWLALKNYAIKQINEIKNNYPKMFWNNIK